MRYACQTLFDITATGITGHYKSTRIPFLDRAGQDIHDQASWERARNQQRNWETIMQIISLRTQIFDHTIPVKDQTGSRWMFEFETEISGAFGSEADPTEILRTDAQGVPMMRELDNNPNIKAYIQTHGSQQNIWFAQLA
jgi:hypothetical protein